VPASLSARPRLGAVAVVVLVAAALVATVTPKVLASYPVAVAIIAPPGANITAGPNSGQSVGFTADQGQPLVFRTDPYAYASTDYEGNHICMVFKYWVGNYSTEDATHTAQGLGGQETGYTVPNDALSVNIYAHYDPDPNWVVNWRWECVLP
jgi:hypothetical protein